MSSSDHQATRTVTSWIQDERKCVSIGSIHTNLGLPKSQAQAVLRQVVDTNKNISYQATNCVVLEEEGVGGEDEKVVKCTGRPLDKMFLWFRGDDSVDTRERRIF